MAEVAPTTGPNSSSQSSSTSRTTPNSSTSRNTPSSSTFIFQTSLTLGPPPTQLTQDPPTPPSRDSLSEAENVSVVVSDGVEVTPFSRISLEIMSRGQSSTVSISVLTIRETGPPMTSSNDPPSASESPSSNGQLNTGSIIGIVLGALSLILVASSLAFKRLKKRRKSAQKAADEAKRRTSLDAVRYDAAEATHLTQDNRIPPSPPPSTAPPAYSIAARHDSEGGTYAPSTRKGVL